MKERTKTGAGKAHWFATTSWTMIEDAKVGSKEALERLCMVYWYPIYAYIRRSGHSPQDAEDLTQGYFYQLLKRSFFRAADRTKGKFRSFLLASLKYYLLDQRALHAAQKRGGGIPLISLDEESPEGRYLHEPVSDLSPEKMFDRQWARTVLDQVVIRLREEHRAKGKLDLYEKLRPFLLEDTAMRDYEQVAAELQMKASTVAVTVHRLRHRYRELVRAEIARTVASPEEINSEMEHFYSVMG